MSNSHRDEQTKRLAEARRKCGHENSDAGRVGDCPTTAVLHEAKARREERIETLAMILCYAIVAGLLSGLVVITWLAWTTAL